MTTPPSSKRISWWQRNYVVNRKLQTKFAMSAVFIGVFSSFISVGLLLWSFWAFNIWQGQRLPPPVLLTLLLILLLNIGGIYISTILATHKIVGPIFNLLGQFQKISKGDYTARANFRDSDEMHYVARRFNEMVSKLNERNEFIEETVAILNSQLEQENTEAARLTAAQLLRYIEDEKQSNPYS